MPAGNHEFADLLRQHRLAAGLTQEALAERAGLSLRGVSDLERGARRAPHRDTVRRLTAALGLDAAEQGAAMAAIARIAARDPTPSVRPTRQLPRQLTSFVGRADELAQVDHLLSSGPLVTLVGAGGVGKTRLALEVADRQAAKYPDGVRLVELAPLNDSMLVPQVVAAAFGLHELAATSVSQLLAEHLAASELLLVLDNCEHLVDACAAIASDLLQACPGIHILATSREPLGIPGERTCRVPSLPLPESADVGDTRHLEDYPSVRLFVERARVVQPMFSLTTTNATAVSEICRHLDGIPLAIELAAARVRALSVEDLAARLATDLRLLSSNTRAAVPRHQTLRAAVAWSDRMLSASERVLFRRLAIFAGGCSLDSVEAICLGDGIDSDGMIDLVTTLVDKSLVVAEDTKGGLRYRLLEPIRQYAFEKLIEAGEAATWRTRHAEWFLSVAERVPGAAGWAGPHEIAAFDQLEAEHDNLRAALRWFLDQADGEAALRLTSATYRFWDRRGYHVEACRWFDRALEAGADAPPALRGKALNAAAQARWVWGDYSRAIELAEEALLLCRAVGDERGVGWAYTSLGNSAQFQGQNERAVPLFEQSLRHARAAGDDAFLAIVTATLARALRWIEDPPHPRSAKLLEDSLSIARAAGSRHATAVARAVKGDLAWQQHKTQAAADLWRQALQQRCELQDARGTAGGLERAALCAAALGDLAQAARLFGAAETQRERLGLVLHHDESADHVRWVEVTRHALGDAEFTVAWAHGRGLPRVDAIREALEVGASSQATKSMITSSPDLPAGLTPREAEVLRLVAQGRSNRDIADVLVLSPRTIKRHIENIFDKLGVSSRAAATAFALRSELVER